MREKEGGSESGPEPKDICLILAPVRRKLNRGRNSLTSMDLMKG